MSPYPSLEAKILLLPLAWGLYIHLDRKCKKYPSTYTIKEIICSGLCFTLCCLAIFVFFLWQGKICELPDVLKNSFVLTGHLSGIALLALQIQHEITSSPDKRNSLIISFIILIIVFGCNVLSIFFYEICSNQNTERVISYLLATILFPAVIIQSLFKMLLPLRKHSNKYPVTVKSLSGQGEEDVWTGIVYIEPIEYEEEGSK